MARMVKCPYDKRTEEVREKIMQGRTSWKTNEIYENKKYEWYYYINQKGYIHILKPVRAYMSGGKFTHYAMADLLLKPDNTLRDPRMFGTWSRLPSLVNGEFVVE